MWNHFQYLNGDCEPITICGQCGMLYFLGDVDHHRYDTTLFAWCYCGYYQHVKW